MIKLDRVELRDAMNVPGKKVDVYPGRENVLVSKEQPNNRLSSKQHFDLFLDEDRGVVLVSHPDSDAEPEKVPMTNVLSYRETPAAKTPAKK